MPPASTAVWAWIHNTSHGTKIVDAFALRLFLHVWLAKTWRLPIWATLLTTPLHGVVYEVWDLPHTSMSVSQLHRHADIWMWLWECSWQICSRALPWNSVQWEIGKMLLIVLTFAKSTVLTMCLCIKVCNSSPLIASQSFLQERKEPSVTKTTKDVSVTSEYPQDGGSRHCCYD